MVNAAVDVLRAAAPGERWVVRVRQPDGSATDLIGWVGSVGADSVVLDPSVDPVLGVQSDPWPIALDSVIAARRAPDARGGPDPRRTPADVLEHLSVEAWAVELEPLGDWTLRSAGGFTGRANSCLAVGDPGTPVGDAAARIAAYSEARGIVPMAQVVDGSEEEAALRALGWVDTYVQTDVLAVRLAELLAGRVADPPSVVGAEVDETLTPAWRAAYDESRPSTVDPAVVTRLLDGRRPRAYASVTVGGEVAALARGHLADGWLQIAGVWTRPEHRRRGLGTAVMLGLARWAARRDARWCYLQVETENGPAHTAYERLGFALHHRYHYLAPPDLPTTSTSTKR